LIPQFNFNLTYYPLKIHPYKFRNLKLLSFGEEEEEESTPVRQFKSKSSHDLANDPTLSAVPAVESEEKASVDEEKKKY
jgi:hypothetical protein